jgi:hypothetical protein
MASFVYNSWIPAPPESVFAFHERPEALEVLIPPWTGARVMERTGGLRMGARVRLRIPVGPFHIDWLALHTGYEKDVYFEDVQTSGPFRSWRHRHEFTPERGGTRLTDRIEYTLPLAPLSHWLAGWVVRLQLRRMFDYRHRVTTQALRRAA